MAGWVDRQVDRWIDRRIDRYVDKKLDAFLKDKMSEEDFRDLKALTRKGEPLDEATQDRLRDELGDSFDAFIKVHNGVVRMERFDANIKKVTRILP